MQFGEHLRALRRAAGLSQEELAARAGLTAHGVSALERGTRTRPYPHTVRALAHALGLDAAGRERMIELAHQGAGQRSARPSAPAAPLEVVAPGPPLAPTALLGRADEVAAVRELLDRPDVRLVTVTGAGGVGKTRLCLEVLRTVEPATFVALAPLSEPALVASVIALSLGLPDAAGRSAATLAEALAERELLLVLDNFEHLLPATSVVTELLAGAPKLTILVSSRAPLRVRGENELPLAPLGVPSAERSPRPVDVTASPAVKLFLERARAVHPGFEVTDHNAADVASICRRLGGLPLALELAAAKVRVLAPGDLLARLDTALAAGSARDLPERHQTMRATLDWSLRLLGSDQQAVFRRLTVFPAPFSLDAAEALLAPLVGVDRVVEMLQALAEQSLLVVRHESGGTRYGFLEPIRQYGAELLVLHGEWEATAADIAAYYLGLVERAAGELRGADQVRWLRLTEDETDNLRAAIAGALVRRDGETAARLCWEMWLAWWIGGRFREGQRWVTEAMEYSLTPWTRTRAMLVRAVSAYAQSDFAEAAHWWDRALESGVGSGDAVGEAYGAGGVGLAAMSAGDFDLARVRLRRALDIAEEVGEEWLASLTNIWLGTLLLVQGDPAASVPVFESAMAAARARDDRLVVYVALFNLASAALAMDDVDRAEELLRESAVLSGETRDAANLAFALDGLAVVAARRGDPARSAVLLGSAEAMRRRSEGRVYHYYLPDEALREATRRAAQEGLGPAFDAAWAEGLAAELEDAVRLAT